jgi:Domain of unknown function (DUF4258)
MGATLDLQSMTNVQLQKHIRTLAKKSDSIFFTEHSLSRMLSRDVTDVQVIECLRYGLMERPPRFDRKTGHLKCRMEHFGTNRNISVIVALDMNDSDVIVVTVITNAN